jgi:hypothetical protein
MKIDWYVKQDELAEAAIRDAANRAVGRLTYVIQFAKSLLEDF